jgi:NADH kinase
MNEVALHRGSSPHLNTIDAYVDGQHLTEAVVWIIRQLTSFR